MYDLYEVNMIRVYLHKYTNAEHLVESISGKLGSA